MSAPHQEPWPDVPDMRETEYGFLRQRVRDGARVWQLRCPGCGTWGDLDDDQLRGRVSVDHTDTGCTYHETHDFDLALVDAGLRGALP